MIESIIAGVCSSFIFFFLGQLYERLRQMKLKKREYKDIEELKSINLERY